MRAKRSDTSILTGTVAFAGAHPAALWVLLIVVESFGIALNVLSHWYRTTNTLTPVEKHAGIASAVQAAAEVASMALSFYCWIAVWLLVAVIRMFLKGRRQHTFSGLLLWCAIACLGGNIVDFTSSAPDRKVDNGESLVCVFIMIYSVGNMMATGARRPRTPGHGIPRCPYCGYDLTGNISGTCPECGRLAPASLQRPLTSVPPPPRRRDRLGWGMKRGRS